MNGRCVLKHAAGVKVDHAEQCYRKNSLEERIVKGMIRGCKLVTHLLVQVLQTYVYILDIYLFLVCPSRINIFVQLKSQLIVNWTMSTP